MNLHLREAFCFPIQLSSLHGVLWDQQGPEPPSTSMLTVQMSLCVSWWLLCLQGGGMLRGMSRE